MVLPFLSRTGLAPRSTAPWLRPWLLPLLLFMACIPTSQPPPVTPDRTLELGSDLGPPAAEPFRVVMTGADGEVGANAQLNLVFNRPVRDLGPAGAETLPPIGMTPAIDGRWRWVGSSALVFEPSAGRLPLGTRVEVEVAAGVRAQDGSTLDEPARFAVETPRPRLVHSHPYDGSRGIGPRQDLELYFDQTIDPAELKRAATLTASSQGKRQPIDFTVLGGDADSPERVTIRPSVPLPAAHAVELVIDASLRGREGPLPTGETRVVRFETYGPLQVQHVNCPKGPSGRACSPLGSVSLDLSNEVLLRDAKKALVIEPAVPLTWESWREDDEPVSYLYLHGPFTPGQTYTLRVRAGLQDVYGQRLATTFTHRLTIDDHWPNLAVGLEGDSFEPGARAAIPVASINVPTYSLLTLPLSPEQVAAYYAATPEERGFDFLRAQPGARLRQVDTSQHRNRVATESIDPQVVLAAQGGRGTMAIATRRQTGKSPEHTTELVQVTDLAITAKLSRQGSLVWVTKLSTAEPVAGAEVRVLRSDASPSPAVLTDARGFATLAPEALGPEPEKEGFRTLITARLGDDWAHRRVSDYLAPWRMNVPTDVFGKPRTRGLLFTERGIYRPGDEVRLKGILRREAQTGNDVLSGKRFTLLMRAPDGEIAGEWELETNTFGTFAQDLRVPPTAALGPWRFELKGVERGYVATSFEVAEYRPTELQATVASARPSYIHGARGRFEVQGDYLYGAPMANAPVTYWAHRHETFWRVPDTEGFITDATIYDAAHPESSPSVGTIVQGEGTLDAKGRFLQEVPLDLPGQRGPELVTFDAEVTDVSRQTVASSSSAIVHPADLYVALAEPKDYFVQGPAKLEPQVIVTSPAGERRAGTSVRLELVRRQWTLARITEGGSVRSEMRVVDDVVSQCTVRSAPTPQSCGLEATEPGYYIVLGTARDGQGRTARAAIDAYVLGAGQSHWADDDTAQLELVPDKKQYGVGDTARILVKSPFPEAQALVTVEGNGIFEQRRVVLKGATPTVEIPIEGRFRPNAYVSVHLVRPRTAPAPEAGKVDLGAPTYRIGHAELPIDPEARRLRISVSPNVREARPGQQIEVGVRVTDGAGAPVSGEVTLYAVDEGVLSLIGYKTPDPLPVFTAPRPLRTATIEARASLGRVLTDVTGLLGLGPNKGAEGGGGGSEGTGARRDFRQSVYFNPTLVTDANGRARVSFALPESLTTYRLMAVVTTRDDRYGYGEERVVTSKRLMARPALPRLLRAGDLAEAGVVVSAKDFGPARVQVQLDASGVELLGDPHASVELPRDGQVEVRFPIAAREVGDARLTFRVVGGGEKDAVELERRVLSPATLEAVALYGQTETAAAEALGDLSAVRRDVGALEIKAASTALVGIDAGFRQLIEYPYGCTEQLSSKLLPLLPLRTLAKDFDTELPAHVDTVVAKTVAEILSRQGHDGGFVMWPESPASSPWVSAYAVWTLHEAARRGVPVPAPAMTRAKQYLRRQLEVGKDEISRAAAPLLLDVLAELGAPDPGYMSQLFDERRDLPVFSRALLLHAMAVSKQPSGPVAELTRELEATLHLEADRAFVGDDSGGRYATLMDSPTRSTALVLRGLLAARKDHPLGARLARGLLASRKGGTWRSTQETAFALLALDDYRTAQEAVKPDFVARLWFDREKVAEYDFRTGNQKRGAAAQRGTARQSLIPTARLTSGNLVFEKEGAGTLFYEARLRYARTTLPTESLERGFFVQKTLREVTPAELAQALEVIPSQGVDSVTAGRLVLADLLLVAPSDREYVVLDDPLPAGLEAVDARLSTTAGWADIGGSATDRAPPQRGLSARQTLSPSHYRRELRDDRVLFFVDHLPAGIYHYRYLARATTPGRFVVPPTQAEEMYNPEVFGRTGASSFEVR
ncbi:MAG: hypothetical protein GX607_03405 [Myxococcales bacterium]|nr:hypothetical protein [Myxococcales bacterium]